MAYVAVDPKTIKFDIPKYNTEQERLAGINEVFSADIETPTSNYIEVDPKQIKFDEPKINQTNDAAKSLVSGVERGVAAVPFTLPNLINQAVAGPQLLGRGIADTVSPMLGADPQPRGPLWQPFYGSEDALQALPEVLRPHDAETTGGIVADMVGQFAGGAIGSKAIPSAKSPRQTADEVRERASLAYKNAAAQGGILKPNITDNFINQASSALPQTDAGKLVLGESATSKLVERLQQLKGKNLSLDEAQEIDIGLGEAANSHVDPKTGRLNAEGTRIQKIQQGLRDAIENASDTDVIGGKSGFNALKEGRSLWSQSAKLRDIESIIERAQTMNNPSTGIQTGFRNLYANKARLRGYSEDEIAMIKKAADTGIVGDALGMLGSRLGTIGSIVTGNFANAAATGGVGAAARGLRTQVQMNRANQVADAISARNTPSQQPPVNASTNLVPAAALGGIGAENVYPDLTLEQILALPPAEARKYLQRVK